MKLNYLTPQILCAIFAIASFATPGKAADKVYDKACAEYTKGDYKAAKDDFLSASKQNPKNWQALYQLANCYVQLKDFTNAKKSYADCLTLGEVRTFNNTVSFPGESCTLNRNESCTPNRCKVASLQRDKFLVGRDQSNINYSIY